MRTVAPLSSEHEDRQAYFGLIPYEGTRYAGAKQEEAIREKKRLP
jgi:hypothetical protein